MAGFSGRYEFGAQGRGSASGPCEFAFDAETATVAAGGPPLAFDLGDIDVFAAGDYELSLSLFDGLVLRLSHVGRAFQTLTHDLRDAHRARLVKCLLVSDLDEVARFEGSLDGTRLTRPCHGRGEVRVYEGNLAFLFDGGGGFQWRLADLDGVVLDDRDYLVVVSSGDESIRIGQLAKRTGELVACLRGRLLALKDRAARALHAVLPFLSPAEFQRTSALMREGACVPLANLRSIHGMIVPTLLERVVDPDLRPYVAALAERSAGDAFVGWKVIRREAGDSGDAVGDDGAEAPDVAVAGEPALGASENGSAPGPRGLDSLLDLGEGVEALFWYLFPIAAGSSTATHLAWEATSREGRATYVFRLEGGGGAGSTRDAAASVNRGLVALNFRRAPIYLTDRTLASDVRYRHYAIATRRVPELRAVRDRFGGRAIHTGLAPWTRQLERLLTGRASA